VPDGQGDTQGIFISYRRADSRADAGRLYDRLAAQFGSNNVFMDIDDIRPGQDFQLVLQQTLASCRVLLVLIGPGWLRARDEHGSLRLEDEQDLVRLELQTALQRGIPLIPVLVNRAEMPSPAELPASLASLAQRQALAISDSRFHGDVNKLISALEPVLAKSGFAAQGSRYRFAVFAGGAAVIGFLLFWLVAYRQLPMDTSPAQAPTLSSNEAGPALKLRDEPRLLDRGQLITMLVTRNFFDAALNSQGAGPGNSYEVRSPGGAGIVIDHGTGLMWQQTGLQRQMSFPAAKQALAGLNRRNLAGYGDWRMPTLEEAMSLLTPSKQAGAHVTPVLLAQEAPIMWTADRLNDSSVWVVYCFDGRAEVESVEFNAWMRAVRSVK
jgi:hypothetical protein